MEFMACARDLVSPPRAKTATESNLATWQKESSESSKADAKAAALEALAAEKKSAEAKILQGEEDGGATTGRSHEMANPTRQKARKEGHELTEEPKTARAREFTRKNREKKQAEEAGGAQENGHDDMGAEEERDDTFGEAATALCDASTPPFKEPRLPSSDLPPNACDGSEEMSEGANE